MIAKITVSNFASKEVTMPKVEATINGGCVTIDRKELPIESPLRFDILSAVHTLEDLLGKAAFE